MFAAIYVRVSANQSISPTITLMFAILGVIGYSYSKKCSPAIKVRVFEQTCERVIMLKIGHKPTHLTKFVERLWLCRVVSVACGNEHLHDNTL